MNFSPQVRAWILLISLVVSTGGVAGLAAFTGGASLASSIATGVITGASNVYFALSASPKDKAVTKAPFPKTTP